MMKSLAIDALVIGGFGLVVYGVALVSVPAAFVIGGACIALIGVALGLRSNTK